MASSNTSHGYLSSSPCTTSPTPQLYGFPDSYLYPLSKLRLNLGFCSSDSLQAEPELRHQPTPWLTAGLPSEPWKAMFITDVSRGGVGVWTGSYHDEGKNIAHYNSSSHCSYPSLKQEQEIKAKSPALIHYLSAFSPFPPVAKIQPFIFREITWILLLLLRCIEPAWISLWRDMWKELESKIC